MPMNADASRPDGTQAFTLEVLEGMYEQHSPGIYRYAYRILGDQHLAEECVSETFSRFLRAVKRGKGPRANAPAYLYRTAHNWSVDYYRYRRPATVPLEAEWIGDESQDLASIEMQKLNQERIRRAVLQLPDDQRNVILLRVLEGMPHEQVAEILDKTPEASRALQYRALGTLRRLLGETENASE
jgi:RNA polymerase sigma-70 factor, ECF subfamily